ncbi:MAG: S41 family peptidase [Chitinophagaceae bacterium]
MILNKTFIKIPATIALFATCLIACRRELPQVNDPESGYATSYADLFERFWSTMNSRYQFWDKDTTDWDAMYTRYHPLFAKLDIYNEDDQRTSIRYFREMLAGNLDGHLQVYFEYSPVLYDSTIYPRLTQNEKHINPNFVSGELQRTPGYYYFTYYGIDAANYLDAGSIYDVYDSPVLGYPITVLGGTINNNVVYLGFDGQALSEAMVDPGINPLKSAYTAFSQALKNNPAIKGAIVDMRGSTGGDGTDATLMASGMIGKRLVIGSTRYKNGPGRLDYTPWTPTYIDPAPGAKAINVPLVILTDVITFSAAEHITAALHAIPGAITVGTATRGGNIGTMINANMQGKRGADFKVVNIGDFMGMDCSAGRFRSPDGTEPIWGLKPDYEVPFDTLAIQAGRDPQLEKALSLIR